VIAIVMSACIVLVASLPPTAADTPGTPHKKYKVNLKIEELPVTNATAMQVSI